MRLQFDPSLIDYELADLLAMPPEEVVALAWRSARRCAWWPTAWARTSTTSSRPPSSDDPYRREERGKPASDAGAETPAAPSGKAGKLHGKLQREGDVQHVIAQRLTNLSSLLGDLVVASRNFH